MARSMQILVVDESAADAKLVAQCLEAHGYQVRTSSDGIEALVEIDQNPPALVLLEMELPRLAGVDLARAIRSHAQTRRIPMMFLTRRGDPRSMIEGINVGAKSYMTKPFENDDLISKVKKAIR